jgi:VWFA-related protein
MANARSRRAVHSRRDDQLETPRLESAVRVSLTLRTLAIIALLLAVSVTTGNTQQPTPGNGAPGAPATAGAPAAPDQQPVFRAGINFVRVDAIVTDKQGNPVADLKQTDFEVLEDGKPQTIEQFRFIRVDGSAPREVQSPIRTRADEERAAANDDARIFVFFLDDYHVRLGNSMAARKPLIEFIETSLGPNDLVAVMYPLSPLDIVSLTRDHESVIRAIERFEGRKFNYEPKFPQEQRYALYPAETVERIRRQVSLSAIEGLSVKLGALREGRKAVIVVSEGYTAVLPPQLRDPIAAMPGMGNPNRRNPLAGENSVTEDRADFIGQLDVQQEMQEVFNAANRSNTALYTVDPRGLATGEFDISENVGMQRSSTSLRQTQDTLRILADETDGRAFVNRNDFGKAMKQIVADSSAYYLLGYNSSQAPQDGKFHEIKVRVKRSGAEVRARKGYWALTAADTARATTPRPATPPAINRALSSIAEPSRGRFVRTWVGTSRGENGNTRVTFVWEPIAALPGVRRENATAVSLIAASPDGDTYFRGDVPQPGNGTPATTLRQTTFEAPPGRLQLRMGIVGADGPIDSDDREVIVPDLTAAEVAFATPRVFVARTARDFQMIRTGENATPTASREFRRTERLVVKFDTYGPGDAPVPVTARLLNKQGARLADIPVTSTAGAPHLIDLPLSAFAPAEYLLELTGIAEGQQPVVELIAFRVEG